MHDVNESHLVVVGVSFRTAPVAVREALGFDASQILELLAYASKRWEGIEAAVLSTCNRTEFYLVTQTPVVTEWLQHLRLLRPDAPVLRADCLRYEHQGSAAMRHLLRVACGLDSAILGDAQVLGQVKDALTLASRAGTTGAILRRVFEHAIRAAKVARRRSCIGQGAVSVGSAVADLLIDHAARRGVTRPPAILVLGAGEASRNVVQHLLKRRCGSLHVANRTDDKAIALANYCCGRAWPWQSLPKALAEADTVVTAMSAAEPVIRQSLLLQVMTERRNRPLLIIDLGVPRNVEYTDRTDLPVTVMDIDAIQGRREKGFDRRRNAIPAVEQVIAEELSDWERWLASLPIEHTIKSLYCSAANCAARASENLAALGTTDPVLVQQVIHRAIKRLLHDHTSDLRRLIPHVLSPPSRSLQRTDVEGIARQTITTS